MDKEKIKNLLESPMVAVFFTIICILVIFSLHKSSQKAEISKESIKNLEEGLKIEEKNLEKEKDKLKNSQEQLTIEKMKRNELLLKREGEITIQIPEKEQALAKNSEEKEETNSPQKEWKELLFD